MMPQSNINPQFTEKLSNYKSLVQEYRNSIDINAMNQLETRINGVLKEMLTSLKEPNKSSTELLFKMQEVTNEWQQVSEERSVEKQQTLEVLKKIAKKLEKLP